MPYDIIIVGSGAAGLSAGIYAGRYLMKTLIVRGEFGGETAKAGTIWNYPSTPGMDGYEIMQKMEGQAKESGAEFADGKLIDATNKDGCYTVLVQDSKEEKTFYAKTIIFAQGSERRRLGLPDEDRLTSKGVHYCVTCDGPLYGGKVVGMVGGGDASAKGVLHLADYVEKIYYIVRGDKLRAEPVNEVAMRKLGDKVVWLMDTSVLKLIGEKRLERVALSREYNGTTELAIDGLFVEIGAKPDVAVPVSLGVTLDKLGYVDVDNMMRTNVPGIYAAGDAVNHFGQFKQTITAAALGAVAATSAYEYHKTHGELCRVHLRPAASSTYDVKSAMVDGTEVLTNN
ncbi:MAG: thioredoxin reductase [Candidatus Vogelbacteria bacterium CG10_big_fil_rev_8_21_14_0_10_51_16]|uniref:Thioredoxin reductase n=1 Tax=Candidatus Vogelbacteria bacterium CG10_big_fil_rev_8_21_14_0_10_51_16 TaxID=1975045 RepID=A0A2H0RDK1_9BACT|nr:MAG: thioredoxin reductase [Candidatus Vogelbacteria bacterium CG10_big_fil_rev_8_21_14_0_10_51_16]